MNAINANIKNAKDIYTSADKHQDSEVIVKYNIGTKDDAKDDAATLSLSKEGMRRASELTGSDKELTPNQIQKFQNVANELASQANNPELTQIQRVDIHENLNKVHLQLSEAADTYVSPDNFTVTI